MTRGEFESAKFHDSRLMVGNSLILFPMALDRRLLIEHLELLRATVAAWGPVPTEAQVAEIRALVEMWATSDRKGEPHV